MCLYNKKHIILLNGAYLLLIKNLCWYMYHSMAWCYWGTYAQ